MTSADLKTTSSMGREVREELSATFDALTNWRDDITNANERYLDEVLDRTSALARAMGWPDQAVSFARQYVEGAAKAQTAMMDQTIEAWKRRINSTSAPTAFTVPKFGTMPGFGTTPGSGTMPEFNALAPWTFWQQAVEVWQRALMPDN